jgi:hypothetical protein
MGEVRDDHDDDEYCPNCGGTGFVYDCIDGFCEDAESGCDLCERRCDWCNPPRPVNHQNNPMSEVLAEALSRIGKQEG